MYIGESFTREEVDNDLLARGFLPGTVAYQHALRLTYFPTDDPNLFVEREVPVVLTAAEYEAVRTVSQEAAFIDLYDQLRTATTCATHEWALRTAAHQWHSVNAD